LISALTSMQNLVDSAVSNANDAISSMTDAGYSQKSINNAKYDLDTATAVKTALSNALAAANELQTAKTQEANASAALENATSTKEQLQNAYPSALGDILSKGQRAVNEAQSANNSIETVYSAIPSNATVKAVKELASQILETPTKPTTM
ncbi:MAG: hypothetical protein IIY58_05840, partial [Aeriscardovia sp.]|nr:hypothetical protein [Aeriscardovia sp.]